jgi:CBS domain-containing protein
MSRIAAEPTIKTRVQVTEIMNSPVQTIDEHSSVQDAAGLMSALSISSVIVTRGIEPVGILTERDIVGRVVARGRRPGELAVGEVMSEEIHTIESTADFGAAAKLMAKHRVKILGVTRRGKLEGVVTATDIVRVAPHLLDVISEKSMIISGGGQRAESYVAGYCDFCNQWSDLLVEMDGKFGCDDCTSEQKKDEENS